MKSSKIYEICIHRKSKDETKFVGQSDMCIILHVSNKRDITIENLLAFMKYQDKKHTPSREKAREFLIKSMKRMATFHGEVSSILSKHKGKINFNSRIHNDGDSRVHRPFRDVVMFSNHETDVYIDLREIQLYEF